MTTLPGGLRPNKHLSQNFLKDPRVVERILEICRLSPDEHVLEIGAGTGVLTLPLAGRVRRVYALEYDPALCALLRTRCPENTQVVCADILRFDLSSLPPGVKIVGNLPYHISTPILRRLIRGRDRLGPVFLMLQREYARRLTARPGGKDYGALGCLLQYHADVRILFAIPPRAFRPVPKVASSFLEIAFRTPEPRSRNEELLIRIIETAFAQRRKKVGNTLGTLVGGSHRVCASEIWSRLKNKRPEELSIGDFVELSDVLDAGGTSPDRRRPS